MNCRKHQQGITLFGFLLTLFLIGFVAYTTLKLLPVYLQNFEIRSSIKSMENEPGKEYSGVMAVRDTILKRFEINNVTQATRDDISVTREGQAYYVDVDYKVTIPFIANISLLVDFTNHAEVPAR